MKPKRLPSNLIPITSAASPPKVDVFAAAEHAPPPPAPEHPREMILLLQLRIDGGTQARLAIDEPTVQRYRAKYAEGGHAALPALVVFFDGADYWLADGFHRYHAGAAELMPSLPCEVRPGTRRDAVLYAVGANEEHGLPRSKADKHRAVEILLADPEWQGWADREIARRAKVSPTFVATVRAELKAAAAPGPATVHGGQSEEAAEADPRPRRMVRGGREVVINTAKIGSRQRDLAAERRHEDAKRPLDAEAALAVPCSQCKAVTWRRCTNYKGQGCAPHRERMKAAAERRQDEQVLERVRKGPPAKKKTSKEHEPWPLSEHHTHAIDWRDRGAKWPNFPRAKRLSQADLRRGLAFHFRDLLAAVKWGSLAAGGDGNEARDEALALLVEGANKEVRRGR